MATKPVDKGFSVNRFDGNGSETVWEFSFEGSYINREYVKAYTYNPQTRVETPVVFEWINDFSIRVVPAVPAGMQLVVFRDTPKDTLLVDFRAGALRTPENLHKDFTQALNVATEAMDEANSMTAAADYAVDTAELALSVANMASSSAATAVVIAEGAESTAEAAEGAAAQAVSTANTARNIAEGIDAQVKDAVSKATSAVSTANSAQSTANAATTTANTAKATAEGIDAKATAAVSTANTAKSTADTAKSTADAVDAKATAAQNSAALAAAQAQTAANDAAAAAAAVAGKADKSYVDTQDALRATKTYVDTQDALKADKTYVDAVKATADAAMPKSGGTFTGTLTHQGNIANQYINGGTPGAVKDETAHLRVGKLAEGNAAWASSAMFGSDGALTLTGSTLRWNTNDLGRWAALDPTSFISTAAGPQYRLAMSAGAYYTANTEVSPDNGPWYGFGFETSHFSGNIGLYFGAYGGFRFYSQNDAVFSAKVRAVEFITTSDARLKDNIASRVIPLQDLATVLPKSWDWKDGRGHSSGAIAQEIEAILPEMVHADAEGMLSVSEGKAALVIALSLAQHLKAANERIASLERALYGIP